MDVDQVILHEDNAPAHRANSTQITLLVVELLDPPYSTNLALIDFRLFSKTRLPRRYRFNSESPRWKVSQFDTGWYRDTFTKWIAKHQECVALRGDYVEKVRCSLNLDDVWHQSTLFRFLACIKWRTMTV